MLTLAVLWLGGPAVAAETGREVYVAKCQACHGDRGRGDGPAARALPKKPRDFSVPTFWASVDDAQVERVILNGLPGTIMRGFPMPPEQLDALLAYLKGFVRVEG